MATLHSIPQPSVDPRPPPESHCSVCRAPASISCASCGSIFYCSRYCQLRGWRDLHHQLVCLTLGYYAPDQRPSALHKRVIIFSEYTEEPWWFWLGFSRTPQGYERPDFRTFSPVFNDYKLVLQIERNSLLGRDIPERILVFRDTSIKDPARTTKSFCKIDKAIQSCSLGTIIAVGLKRSGQSFDLSATDFGHIVDQIKFTHVQFAEAISQAIDRKKAAGKPMQMGVRLNCVADIRFEGRPEIEPYDFSAKYWDYLGESEAVQVGRELQIPLTLRRSRVKLWKGRRIDDYYAAANRPALALTPFNPISIEIGSVLVGRDDGKPLHVAHMWAIIDYCRFREQTVRDRMVGMEACDDKRWSMWCSLLSKYNFQSWYRTWADEHGNDGKGEIDDEADDETGNAAGEDAKILPAPHDL